MLPPSVSGGGLCMRYVIALLGLAACGSGGAPPDSFSATSTLASDADVIDSKKEFENAVVGHQLRGDGVDVVVAPGGLLVGTQFGTPFSGTWEYRRGLFCHSLTGEVRRAKDRKCFRAAVIGRTVHLVPVER